MIEVSNSFKEKSLSPGRTVRCVIEVDDFLYTDKEIISFEFNDVVHPDDMSFGTACANRFHFELWSRKNIPLSAVIKPFVFFEDDSGTEESCPLGEFYIARRYRKRERYSITCYDKMYRLDPRYNPNGLYCKGRFLLPGITDRAKAACYVIYIAFADNPQYRKELRK